MELHIQRIHLGTKVVSVVNPFLKNNRSINHWVNKAIAQSSSSGVLSQIMEGLFLSGSTFYNISKTVFVGKY